MSQPAPSDSADAASAEPFRIREAGPRDLPAVVGLHAADPFGHGDA